MPVDGITRIKVINDTIMSSVLIHLMEVTGKVLLFVQNMGDQ